MCSERSSLRHSVHCFMLAHSSARLRLGRARSRHLPLLSERTTTARNAYLTFRARARIYGQVSPFGLSMLARMIGSISVNREMTRSDPVVPLADTILPMNILAQK